MQEALFAIKNELASSNATANGTSVVLRHFDAIESLVRRNIHSSLNGIASTNLKSFSSVPVNYFSLFAICQQDESILCSFCSDFQLLSNLNGGSAESLREDQQTPSPNPPATSMKTVQTQSSSGIGSSITPQSSSDDRIMILQVCPRSENY